MKSKQKFPIGTRVYIAKDLGKFMSHFHGDVEAIILYSYAQEFGGDDVHDYAVYILSGEGTGFCAWYHENQLTKIKGPYGTKLALKLRDRTGK